MSKAASKRARTKPPAVKKSKGSTDSMKAREATSNDARPRPAERAADTQHKARASATSKKGASPLARRHKTLGRGGSKKKKRKTQPSGKGRMLTRRDAKKAPKPPELPAHPRTREDILTYFLGAPPRYVRYEPDGVEYVFPAFYQPWWEQFVEIVDGGSQAEPAFRQMKPGSLPMTFPHPAGIRIDWNSLGDLRRYVRMVQLEPDRLLEDDGSFENLGAIRARVDLLAEALGLQAKIDAFLSSTNKPGMPVDCHEIDETLNTIADGIGHAAASLHEEGIDVTNSSIVALWPARSGRWPPLYPRGESGPKARARMVIHAARFYGLTHPKEIAMLAALEPDTDFGKGSQWFKAQNTDERSDVIRYWRREMKELDERVARGARRAGTASGGKGARAEGGGCPPTESS